MTAASTVALLVPLVLAGPSAAAGQPGRPAEAEHPGRTHAPHAAGTPDRAPGTDPADAADPADSADSADPADPGRLQRAFAEAAARQGVPTSVLLAVSYLQSRWDTHRGAPSVSGGYGPMHLTDASTALTTAGTHHLHGSEDPRGDPSRPALSGRQPGPQADAPKKLPPRLRTLERAAELTGLSPRELREDTAANLRGGAALLAAAQRRLGSVRRIFEDRPAAPPGPSGPGRCPHGACDRKAEDRPRTGRTRASPTTQRAWGLPRPGGPRGRVPSVAGPIRSAGQTLGRPAGSDPADWYGAVAAYPAASDTATGIAFADEVYALLRTGEARTTDTGQRVRLPAAPGMRGGRAGVRLLEHTETDRDGGDGKAECPRSVACEWLPAAYGTYTNEEGKEDYGNHDRADRPRSQSIDYIVVHDVEGYWDGATSLIKDPEYVSWHYTLRSSDGHVAQHVANEDVAWHAGNWYLNSKSIGLEHEGFLTRPDAWYTEAMYRSSAQLVKYLAREYGIPLDRQHILGHDNVPGTTASHISGMHTDPGPYWDWDHYFRLLGSPFLPAAEDTGATTGTTTGTTTAAGSDPGLVTIRPPYPEHRPVYTRCDDSGDPCDPHGSAAVRLHTGPGAGTPLVKDIGNRPDGAPSTTGVNDTGARASTGQQYAVAGRKGDWTAIWYLGRKAWFHNPRRQPTAVPATGAVVTPKKGMDSVPVYGRAYPEASAYPQDVPVQEVSPLPYELKAGQKYALGLRTKGEYLWAKGFDPKGEKYRVVRGEEVYHQIQFGHRVAFVRADDVRVLATAGKARRGAA